MPKKVLLEKVGTTTKVTEYFTENTGCKKIKSIYAANLFIEKDEIVADLYRTDLRFKLSELEDNYGCTSLNQLLEELRVRNMFLPQENEGFTGFITYIAPTNSTKVQSSLLIGKQSIDLVVVANGVDQNPESYNSTTGTFDFTVLAGDKLTIFYTN